MNESILNSVKKYLGIHPDYIAFDLDIVMHINTVFVILNQLGYGPKDGFSIEDEHTTWSEYLEDRKDLNLIKSYMGMKVRTYFDPPTNGTVNQALANSISELEWRINITVDPNEQSK